MSTETSLVGSPALLRLLQLSSSLFPIGAFAYSQGLENAVERQWVADEASLVAWLCGLGEHAFGRLDLPLLERAHAALRDGDTRAALLIGERLLANRESRELFEQEQHLGNAFAAVLVNLGVPHAKAVSGGRGTSYLVSYALGAVHFGIGPDLAAFGYAYAWSEQQSSAAARLVPLGHMATQRVVSALLLAIPSWIERASQLADHEIGGLAPALAMGSAWHETQYTRLFRS